MTHAPPSPTPRPTQWTGRTRGGVFGNWVFVTLVRLFGLWPAYVLLGPVSCYFLVAAPKALRASRQYLKRLGLPRRGLWASLRHFYAFGVSILDRIAAFGGQAHRFTIDVEGHDALVRALKDGKGAILVNAHCGNWEMAAHMLGEAIETPVNMMTFAGETPHVDRLFNQATTARRFHAIPLGNGESTMIAIHCALSRGEIVMFLGDRHLGAHTETVDFLGAPARFPAGPYLIAAVTGTPVFHIFTMRTRLFHYTVQVYPPERLTATNRADRTAQVRAAIARYSARLEEQLRQHPYQWLNFYDFWRA
ncbi:MAG TPA: hypothetical protein PLO62_11930 [Candidatus Hydrogenedentes bacterium]|nr:hypothetical protein [Candidatus Hydrogenedentota bacterium]HOS03146.1 hypothetical protein [Candidatus Hydrogenedentota bacterium]